MNTTTPSHDAEALPDYGGGGLCSNSPTAARGRPRLPVSLLLIHVSVFEKSPWQGVLSVPM